MEGTFEEVAIAPPRRRRMATEPQTSTPSTDAIAVRAYELFLERGGEHGRDVEDWLRAERELAAPASEAAALTRGLHEKPRS
jgi:Protein of unknown function (DUF2934)